MKLLEKDDVKVANKYQSQTPLNMKFYQTPRNKKLQNCRFENTNAYNYNCNPGKDRHEIKNGQKITSIFNDNHRLKLLLDFVVNNKPGSLSSKKLTLLIENYINVQ